MKEKTSVCGILILGCALVGSAQAADSDEVARLQSQLAETQQALERLAERVHELEGLIGAAQPTPAAAAAHEASSPSDSNDRLESVERGVAQIAAASASHHSEPGLPLHGFADVSAGTHNPINPDLSHVAVGSLDFYLTPELGPRTSSLFELNFKVGATGDLAVDIERAQFGYQFSDKANLWLGRFHTPYGYYNTAFHHGAQMTSSLRRPLVVQFEKTGGVMPAHTVGLWFTGGDRVGKGRLSYDAYVGNAQHIVNGTLDVRNGGNTTGDRIIGGNLGFLAEDFIGGLKFGASFFSADIGDDLVPNNLTRVKNYGLYVVHDTDRWENIAEFYKFDNEDLTGGTGTHRSDMGFVQLAYRAGLWTPYARYEHADFDQTDHYFAAQKYGGSYRREAVGVRFDLDLTSALKLEFARTHLTDRTLRDYSDALVQYAIRF